MTALSTTQKSRAVKTNVKTTRIPTRLRLVLAMEVIAAKAQGFFFADIVIKVLVGQKYRASLMVPEQH